MMGPSPLASAGRQAVDTFGPSRERERLGATAGDDPMEPNSSAPHHHRYREPHARGKHVLEHAAGAPPEGQAPNTEEGHAVAEGKASDPLGRGEVGGQASPESSAGPSAFAGGPSRANIKEDGFGFSLPVAKSSSLEQNPGKTARLLAAARKKKKKALENQRNSEVRSVSRVVEIRARHIMCTDYTKLAEAYAALLHRYGDNPPSYEFSRTAKAVSKCETASKGGDLGWQMTGPMNSMPSAIQSACMPLEPGQMSRPFRVGGTSPSNPATYHVVFLEDRRNRN